ncbi:DEAD/DEAH box helicase [Lentzea aerocolonigenes]|uniref:DEAD/DEAH box helicase n=1 Tax=Lentzea aerocolonigenes TaxID=68170 RepID=UPI0004C2FA42|nr:AAA domain-containing protein [Lentzea aerocolonigenes]MCP2249239.1 RecB family nuclease, putative, TM0106 family [Lentzea aerocolonigenes]
MLAGPSDLVDLLECEHRSYLGRADRQGDPDALHVEAERTAAEMRAGKDLVENAVFFDGVFHCTAQTLVRTPDGYEPCEEAQEATPLAVLGLTAAAQALGAARAHLVVDGRRTTFRVADFTPLLSRLKTRLAKPSPAPKRSWGDVRAACNGCRFARHCAAGREEARDLSLVAGLRADQRRKLVSAGIDTIDALAATEERPATLSPASFTALTAQARLQVQQERTGVTTYEVVAPEALQNLPDPADDDVFLEVDGDTFRTPGWEGTFAEFVGRTPSGTVYHFTPHDLAGRAARSATLESEVDELVRRCVDLGALTRRVLRVSTREYTLQALKPLLDDENPTRGVRDLLERVKREHEIETAPPQEQDEAAREKAAERARRMAALTEPLIAEGHALFAATVGYHRREASPAWGDFFRQASAPISDLETDSNCAVPITLRAEDWVPPSGRVRTHKRQVHARIDPERPHPFGAGEQVRLLYPGNVTRNAVVADDNPYELVLTESNAQEHSELPVAVLPGSPVPAAPKDEAVAELAEQAIHLLPLLPRNPGIDLLLRTPPGPLPQHPDVVQAVIKAVDQLDGGTLAVQGPPGAGKTYLATKLVKHLIDQGKTVAVTSTSHKAVENVLSSADPSIPMAKRPKGKPEEGLPWDQPRDNGALARWREEHPQGHLVGGTAWTFSNAVIKAQPFDVMIIDEAGQFALADAVAVATAAKNLVLLGDPQQLPQVVQGVHPPGSDASALGHLLGDADVIPEHLGYFLAETRRMHPAVCRPVSDLSYAGLLHSHETAAHRWIDGIDPGIYLREVDHRHNITSSAEEADAVVDTVRALVGRTWTDNGKTRELVDGDILVVAPYNLQVRVIRRRLADAGFDETRVGTVDRFQGQEAPAVIMSMTSSSTVDLPRGLDFLLSRNRLNVALSRAQALAVMICSPRLLDADVRGVDQMRLVAGMLGLLEKVKKFPI